MAGRPEEVIERKDLRREALQITAQIAHLDKLEALTVLTHCRQLLEFQEGGNFVDRMDMIARLRLVGGTG